MARSQHRVPLCQLRVVGQFEVLAAWLELHHSVEAPLTVREVALLEVDAAALVAGVEKADDTLAHPLHAGWFVALPKLEARLVRRPDGALEDASVECVRAQRRLLRRDEVAVSDEDLAHVVLVLDDGAQVLQANDT